jgi:hypothetical protein
MPTQSEVNDSRPLLKLSNSPPPPVDTDTDNLDPPTACAPTPCPVFVAVGGRFFKNPSGTSAFLTFTASVATVEISPDAQVRDQGDGLIGRGTIVTDIFIPGNPTPQRVVVDLSTAEGTLLVSPRPGTREIMFTADATFLSSGLPVPGGVFFFFAY